MTLHTIDPISDARWKQFLDTNPQASIFHTPEWLEALRRTYGYRPFVLTSTEPGTAIGNGIVLCEVKSWITGRRLVGVPFSDHCEPLLSDGHEARLMASHLQEEITRNGWSYVELRPVRSDWDSFASFYPGQQFYLHRLDLTPSAESLMKGFSKDSVQRKLRRQKQEDLSIESGCGEKLLEYFYPLFMRTRRRHRLPPPPRRWFRNLIALLPERLSIEVCFSGARAIASILTLRFKDVLYYKYGCSDERFHRLGGMQALFWNAIQNAKRLELRVFDLGRTDLANEGLLRFKNGWGAQCSKLTYLIYPQKQSRLTATAGNSLGNGVKWMPEWMLAAAGTMIYKHIG